MLIPFSAVYVICFRVQGRVTMEISRLKQVLEDISNTGVAVVGDFCLDAYWMIDPSPVEISLETGKPTQRVKEQRYTLGGASNVVNNLAAMGAESVLAIGVIGDDLFGRELVRQLAEMGVDTGGLLIQDRRWDTPVFGKPHHEGEEQRRMDFGMYNKLEPETEQGLIEQLEKSLDSVQAVIINQQVDNSIYTQRLIKEFNRIISSHPDTYFVVDSRQNSGAFNGVYLKLNQDEAGRLAGTDELGECARNIKQKISARAVIITRGEKGLLVYDDQGLNEIPGIQISKEIDPVGAGDTAVAAIAASLGCGACPREAAEIANLAAAVTVQKLFQCGTASPEEILSVVPAPHPNPLPKGRGD